MIRRLVAALALACALVSPAAAQPMPGGRVLLFADGVQVGASAILDFWNFTTQLQDGRLEIHLPTDVSLFGPCVGDAVGEFCGVADIGTSTLDASDGVILVPSGTTRPATCSAPASGVGPALFYEQSSTSLLACTATNTWTLVGTLGAQSATADVTVGNTATETLLCALGTAANSLVAGRTYRVVAGGRLATHSSGTAQLLLRLRYDTAGTSPSGTIIHDPLVQAAAAGPTLTNNMSNEGWHVQIDVTVRATGSSGTATATGCAFYPSSATAHAVLCDHAAASTVTINTTNAAGFGLYAKWGSAAGANQSLVADTCIIEPVK